VKLEIRTGGSARPYPFRTENEWPLARTKWTKMYLKLDRSEPSGDERGAEGSLVGAPPKAAAKVTYSASGVTKAGVASGSSLSTTHGGSGRTGTALETPPFTEDTEITGPLMLNLWVSSTSEDMDILVTVRNIGPTGRTCGSGQPDNRYR
jgi:predicted acyl esterase